MKTAKYRIANFIGFVAMVTINYLSNYIPFNGLTQAQISEKYANFFVPAGVTFAIWGVIYLLLGVFVFHQAIGLLRNRFEKDSEYLHKIGWLFFLSCLANIAWLFAWHYQRLFLSVIIMLVLLITLAVIYRRLDIGRREVSKKMKYIVHLPFSIYLGWISVATIANVSALFVDLGWIGFGLVGTIWTIIAIAMAIYLGHLILRTRGDIAYTAVIIWALLGILIKRLKVDTYPDTGVVIVTIVGILLLSYSIFKDIRSN